MNKARRADRYDYDHVGSDGFVLSTLFYPSCTMLRHEESQPRLHRTDRNLVGRLKWSFALAHKQCVRSSDARDVEGASLLRSSAPRGLSNGSGIASIGAPVLKLRSLPRGHLSYGVMIACIRREPGGMPKGSVLFVIT
jgi:hypothetical protein